MIATRQNSGDVKRVGLKISSDGLSINCNVMKQ
jgi:hypothetical protein